MEQEGERAGEDWSEGEEMRSKFKWKERESKMKNRQIWAKGTSGEVASAKKRDQFLKCKSRRSGSPIHLFPSFLHIHSITFAMGVTKTTVTPGDGINFPKAGQTVVMHCRFLCSSYSCSNLVSTAMKGLIN